MRSKLAKSNMDVSSLRYAGIETSKDLFERRFSMQMIVTTTVLKIIATTPALRRGPPALRWGMTHYASCSKKHF